MCGVLWVEGDIYELWGIAGRESERAAQAKGKRQEQRLSRVKEGATWVVGIELCLHI